MADGEWDHASRFMERIIQLGGIPISKPVEWEKKAFFSYSDPPRRGNDLKAMIKESLKLERSSLEFYQRLASKTRDTDMVTHKMAMDAMADEAREERKDRKSTRLNSSHVAISYAVFCLKKKQ